MSAVIVVLLATAWWVLALIAGHPEVTLTLIGAWLVLALLGSAYDDETPS